MHVRCTICDRATHRLLRWEHLREAHPVLALTFTAEQADISILFSTFN